MQFCNNGNCFNLMRTVLIQENKQFCQDEYALNCCKHCTASVWIATSRVDCLVLHLFVSQLCSRNYLRSRLISPQVHHFCRRIHLLVFCLIDKSNRKLVETVSRGWLSSAVVPILYFSSLKVNCQKLVRWPGLG